MNEIPKLRYCGMFECDLDDIDMDAEYKDNIGLITCISKNSYKECLAFWEKYKDNCTMFWNDFGDKYIFDNFIKDIRYNDKGIMFDCKINGVEWRDWLHNLIFGKSSDY